MIHVAQRCRVLVDNDWAGDPDGLVALAHHALVPTNRIVAVTSSLTSPMFGDPTGEAERGAALAAELLHSLGHASVPIAAGPDTRFGGRGRASRAAGAIVDVARSEDELPLFVVCAGPLTNIADALSLDAGIAERFTPVWVGGSLSGEWEYNEQTDSEAARFVLAHPGLHIRQVPVETYRRLAISIAELRLSLRRSGTVGRWLWNVFEVLDLPDSVQLGPMWCLGDSAPLVATAIDDPGASLTPIDGEPTRTVYSNLDTRLVLGDFFALLAGVDGSAKP
ncbi:MAG: twin-arginine translocation pathway signal [Cryobacterium sp.]|jgi:purine nucleosidase|nr:twin-arginine translocation pathway signal [Cryobacterium sp.]